MSTVQGVRRSLGAFGSIVGAIGWAAVTIWLGVVGVASTMKFLMRLHGAFATSLRCGRGHRVQLYGTFRCPRCKAVREGRAFDPCGVCGTRCSHIDCERCGLAVKDPQP